MVGFRCLGSFQVEIRRRCGDARSSRSCINFHWLFRKCYLEWTELFNLSACSILTPVCLLVPAHGRPANETLRCSACFSDSHNRDFSFSSEKAVIATQEQLCFLSQRTCSGIHASLAASFNWSKASATSSVNWSSMVSFCWLYTLTVLFDLLLEKTALSLA